MSVRAHHVIKVEQGEVLFNLWGDKLVMDLLGDYFCWQLNDDGVGIVIISLIDIEIAIECLKVKKGSTESELEEIKYTREVLLNLKKLAKKDGCVQIDCF
jgi:hypothetical protein